MTQRARRSRPVSDSGALRWAAAPNWKFTHISDHVLPALRERGVTDEQISTMLAANPRRYFER